MINHKRTYLKPCPSCGSTNIIVGKIMHHYATPLGPYLPQWHWVECNDCHWYMPARLTRHRAIRAWNKWDGVIPK